MANDALEKEPDGLRLLLARQFDWSKETFGAGYRMEALLKHIRKELAEVEAKPTDPIEWIDIALLALDGAWRCQGLTGEEVADLVVGKMNLNRAREWPKVIDPNEPSEHVRDIKGFCPSCQMTCLVFVGRSGCCDAVALPARDREGGAKP